MSIKPVNNNKASVGRKEKDKNKFPLKIDVMSTLDKSTEEYLDRYEGVKSEILNTTKFDENSDLNMTSWGKLVISGTEHLVKL